MNYFHYFENAGVGCPRKGAVSRLVGTAGARGPVVAGRRSAPVRLAAFPTNFPDFPCKKTRETVRNVNVGVFAIYRRLVRLNCPVLTAEKLNERSWFGVF